MKRSGSLFHARIRSPLAALAASLAIAAQTLPAFALGGTNGNVHDANGQADITISSAALDTSTTTGAVLAGVPPRSMVFTRH